ncbi:Arabinanase/levansucrase/invertase superfamily protein [Mycena venus]|uniref:Arabinanase/levansucrase/invertase superfamily protein n=1 Tax=Mycena venus TaxID=2733690 RepID=A0A8H7DE82_9AGAR|nr:Arabinanase/levansucrase/invertase superfamily protein [Mycena venus]
MVRSVAFAIATFGLASAVFSASTPNPPVRLRDLAKRGGTVTGPVIPTDFADPGLILPNGQPPWYVCTYPPLSPQPCSGGDRRAHRLDLVFARQSSLRNIGRFHKLDSSPRRCSAQPGKLGLQLELGCLGTRCEADHGHQLRDVLHGFLCRRRKSLHWCGDVLSTPAGPFAPQSGPILCDASGGGVIDASGFEAPGGALYLVWKVDGNSMGKSTPIFIQPLGADGFTLQGSATQLITDDSVDGGIVEAPSLVFWDGFYYLFFSSNSFNTLFYDVSYAIAKSATGPYTKVQAPNAPLLVSGDCGTAGPGGATVINVLDNFVNAVFHSDINGKDASGGRAMWQIAGLTLSNGVATVNC